MNELVVVQKFEPNSKEVRQLYSHVVKNVIKPYSIKARYIKVEVINDIGRFITPDEFKWLMDYFENRIDHNKLAIALAYCAGLRIHDAVNVKINSFNPDFSYLAMSQCKAHISKKDGVIRSKASPRSVPLPDWLSEDLKYYVQKSLTTTFRGQTLMVGKDGHSSERLFPLLNKASLRTIFQKIRKKHGAKNRWLFDVWQIIKAYDRPNGKLLWERTYYRISCHAFRAAYCTFAYEASGQNLLATKRITGHSETRHLEKYAKTFDIMQKKQRIKEMINEVMGRPAQDIQQHEEIKEIISLESKRKEFIDYELSNNRKTIRVKNVYIHSWKKLLRYCTIKRHPTFEIIQKLILNDFLNNVENVIKSVKEKEDRSYTLQSIENMDIKVWQWFNKVCRRHNKRVGYVLSYLIENCL